MCCAKWAAHQTISPLVIQISMISERSTRTRQFVLSALHAALIVYFYTI